MASLNAAATIVNTGGGQDTLKVGSDKINAHWHDYDAVSLINRTGGNVVAGDVVALDSATDGSVVASDIAGSLKRFFVARATIANTVAGEFARGGSVLCKSQGTINRFEYIKKSATAKAVESTGVLMGDGTLVPPGVLGVATAAAGGGFVQAMWFTVLQADPTLSKSAKVARPPWKPCKTQPATQWREPIRIP